MNAQNPFPGPIGIDGYQRLSGTCSDSDMVFLGNGNLVRTVRLVSIPTVGRPLQMSLFYNSQPNVTTAGPVGAYWCHNFMARLLVSETLVSYLDEGGRQFDFTWNGSAWVLDTSSFFVPMTLTNPSGDLWRLTFHPSQDFLEFSNDVLAGHPDTQGRLVSITDANGNVLTLTYNGSGQLVSVSEATGRALTLAYNGSGQLVELTDPRGESHRFFYDSDVNLTQVLGPMGCVLQYGYATPSNHRITSRTDARGGTYTYSYDEDGHLATVTDAETTPHTVSYAYDTVVESLADSGGDYELNRTTVTDARGQVWKVVFTAAWEVWRIYNPLGHNYHPYFSQEGGLLFESQPFSYSSVEEGKEGPRVNPNNRFRRRVFDDQGNLLQDYDATGIGTVYTYDENQNLTSVTPGQVNLAVGGEWHGLYGADGYLLCAFRDEDSDVFALPGYLSDILSGDGTSSYPFSRFNDFVENEATASYLIDSKVPLERVPETPLRDGGFRAIGLWTNSESDTQFRFRLVLEEAHAFNLSLYTNSSDQGLAGVWPMDYPEQSGREVQFTIEDLDPVTHDARSRTLHITNNAAGVWLTFPVYSNPETPITVRVEALGDTTTPALSALAFDPYENRTTLFEYDETGNLTQVTDPLGRTTQMTYNENGTLAQVTDALERTTHFAYEDTHLNLTRITDALSQDTLLEYDLNGNLTRLEDPDGNVMEMSYDGKNRLVRWVNGEGEATVLDYDANGNLSRVIDPRSRVTQLLYTANNNLRQVIDPLGQVVELAYDEAGNLLSVTDARSNEVQFVYDEAGRRTQVLLPDSQEVHFSLDGLGRLVALTSPNGNQSSLADINLTGAQNLLMNAGAESALGTDPTRPARWVSSEGSQARSSSRSHQGQYSLPLSPSGDTRRWFQAKIPSLPGGRHLTTAWASKAADEVPATFSMGVLVRDLTATVAEVTGSSLTLDGSSADWSQLPLSRVDLPGDAQFTSSNPPVEQLKGYAQSESSTQVWLDDLQLLRLSTGYLYDGERLREVSLPDGSSMRLERDRFGRIQTWIDPLGRSTVLVYDALDRVVEVIDPLGQTVSYAYDEVGNLTSFTDARGQVTSYQYDDLDRLTRLLYPDATYEQFSYTPAGLLKTYTNVRGQEREFFYDHANRLTKVEYHSDDTSVELAYDKMGNLRTLQERNGDRLRFGYDLLDRLESVVRLPNPGAIYGSSLYGSGSYGAPSPNPGWAQIHRYDPNGNRIEFNMDAARYDLAHYDEDRYEEGLTAGALYDSGRYHEGRYTGRPMKWTVPDGYDAMDRMPAFQDERGREVSFEYDADGRRTQITYPNGLVTEASYDMVGRLLGLRTLQGNAERLRLDYAYNPASERIGMRHNLDTWTYQLDFAGRLVEESVNLFADRSADQLARGELELTDLDPGTNRVHLLSSADDFSGSVLNLARWRFALNFHENDDGSLASPLGLRLYQDKGLNVRFPQGHSPLQNGGFRVPPVFDYFGIQNDNLAAVEHRQKLSGDFDVQVDYSDWQASTLNCVAGLMVSVNPVEQSGDYVLIGRSNSGTDQRHFHQINGSYHVTPTTQESGKYRLQRVGSTVTAYYWEDGDWVNYMSNTFHSSDLYASLFVFCSIGVVNIRFTNFEVTSEETYPVGVEGTYQSAVFDAGRSVYWNTLRWTAWKPDGTDVKFQVATAEDPLGPFAWRGPDGTDTTYYTDSLGSDLGRISGRYARYKAFLSTSDGSVTPYVSNCTLELEGLQPPTSRFYSYDLGGNRASKTVVEQGVITSSEVLDSEDWDPEDRISPLNQILRRDITDLSGSITWRYAYDGDGNMTSKSDGTDTWVYTWDEDNRLLSAALNDVTQVSYTYDSLDRMLTRTEYVDGAPGVAAQFVWDRFDLVKEVSPSGVLTNYYWLRNELHSFVRGASLYFVHSDVLGTVRAITDFSGRIVSSFGYDAWGNPLAGSSDGVPGGCPYQFIGALGPRRDDATGLSYMRRRWYDSALAIFVSRDPVSQGYNRYGYAGSNPCQYVDFDGEDFNISKLSSDQQIQWAQWAKTLDAPKSPLKSVYDYLQSNKNVDVISDPTLPVAARGIVSRDGKLTLRINFKKIHDKDVLKECGNKIETVIAHEMGHLYLGAKNHDLFVLLNQANKMAEKSKVNGVPQAMNLEIPAGGKYYPFDEAYTIIKFEDPMRASMGLPKFFNKTEATNAFNQMNSVGFPIPVK